jgi:hypothetical protein
LLPFYSALPGNLTWKGCNRQATTHQWREMATIHSLLLRLEALRFQRGEGKTQKAGEEAKKLI